MIFLLTVGSKELNHSATGDLQNDGRNVKRGVLTAGHTNTTFSGECPPPDKAKTALVSDVIIPGGPCNGKQL